MKVIFQRIGISLAMVLLLSAVCLGFSVESNAAEACATVEGTVASETTDTLIKLNTKDGLMLIKVDADTDFSQCKNILPDTKLVVSLYYGSDAYMHAVAVKDAGSAISVTIDDSKVSTVYGTIAGVDANKSVITFKTQQGNMDLKLDPTSDMSGVKVLALNKYYEIGCARGSDSYMHILTIKDSVANAGSPAPNADSQEQTNDTAKDNSSNLVKVNGKVSSDSKVDLLKLDTASGVMDIKMDSVKYCNTVTIPGASIKVDVAYGDGYWHAVNIYR